jgi:hypothetical protein
VTVLPDDLLREALADAAATVTAEDVRPLTGPARRSRRRRWAIPAAVTAVAAATAGVVIAHRPPEPAVPRMTLAGYAGAKYVVTGGGPPGEPAWVNDAVTGRAIAQVPTPRGTTGFWDVAGTGDNRTFILNTVDTGRALVHFYRLRLSARGTPEQLSELPRATVHGLPADGIQLLAATATKLAYITATGTKTTIANGGYYVTDGPRMRERITVIDQATGDRRVIGLPRGAVAQEPIWAPDGRHLVFTAMVPDVGLRVLDPATGVIRNLEPGGRNAGFGGAAVAADSAQIVALETGGGRSRLVWYSLATLRIAREVPLGREPGITSSLGPVVSGDRVVVVVGDTVYRVVGAVVHRQHIGHGMVDLDPEGAW